MHQSETGADKGKTMGVPFAVDDSRGCMDCLELVLRQGWAAGYAQYCHSCSHGVQIKGGLRIKAVR